MCVSALQGGFLWGVPGRGEEEPEVGGHQVHPQEGSGGQGEQHREWDRRAAQVSQCWDDHSGGSHCKHDVTSVYWTLSVSAATARSWNPNHPLEECKFFITVSPWLNRGSCVILLDIICTWYPLMYDISVIQIVSHPAFFPYEQEKKKTFKTLTILLEWLVPFWCFWGKWVVVKGQRWINIDHLTTHQNIIFRLVWRRRRSRRWDDPSQN